MLGVGWGLQETVPQVRAQGTCVCLCVGVCEVHVVCGYV